MKKYGVWRHEVPLYGDDSYHGYVVVEAETPKQATEIVKGFDKEDGDTVVYDYEVELLNDVYDVVKKCGTYSGK